MTFDHLMNPTLSFSHITLLRFLILFDFLITLFCITVPEDPKSYFKEFQLVTWISAIKLLSIAYINRKIYIERSLEVKNKARLWQLISLGFVFLCLDDVALIHENIDKAIHFIFRMKETGLSDRLDDLIVIIYAVIGILVLRHFKEEIMKFRGAIPYLVGGFLFLIIRNIIDIITNRADIIPSLITNDEMLLDVSNILAVSEGVGKILAESFFIAAFYFCWRSAVVLSRNIQ